MCLRDWREERGLLDWPPLMLRILSDLHYRDAFSRLRRLTELDPLLEGVDTLWLNGDTCDTQSGMPEADVAELVAYFRTRVRAVHFITGNHDPDISTEHWCSTADGRLCAVHGDVFFDDIVPWGRLREVLVARRRAASLHRPELDDGHLHGRLALHRLACLKLPRECDPERSGLAYRLRRLATELFPPRQLLAMLQAWRTFPDLVVSRAPTWFPDAQIVVTGHVHFPRVWRRGALTVINTGAFAGPLGAYAVDFKSDSVTVRRVGARGGRWVPGRVVARVGLGVPVGR